MRTFYSNESYQLAPILSLLPLFLPAAKRHGHAELQVERKKEVTFAFLVIVTSVFGVFHIFQVSYYNFFLFQKSFLKSSKKVKKLIFKNEFPKNCKSSKSCSSLPFGPTPDLSNLLQQSGACYLEIKLPSRLVVCKTRFYLFTLPQGHREFIQNLDGHCWKSKIKSWSQNDNCLGSVLGTSQ